MAKDIEEKRIRASAEKRKIGSWILIGLFGILLLIGLGYRFGICTYCDYSLMSS